MPKTRVVAVSGGFDPIHIGHVELFKKAKALGTSLTVILNNDHWLRAKKGFVFMPQRERAALIRALGADRVYITKHRPQDPDKSVSNALRVLKPDVFANGGDRNSKNTPEQLVCEELGIEIKYGLGRKVQSSSWLTNALRAEGATMTRPWGSMTLHVSRKDFWVKTITVSPGKRLSLQRHAHRDELWLCIEGEVTAEYGTKKQNLRPIQLLSVKKGMKHRLSSKRGGKIVELAYGVLDEDDIVREADDFGRI